MRLGSKPEKNQDSQLIDVTICELTHNGVYQKDLQDFMARKQYSNIYQGKCDLHTFVLSERQGLSSSLNFICRDGGIGRHTALKMLRASAHTGSSPVLGINTYFQLSWLEPSPHKRVVVGSSPTRYILYAWMVKLVDAQDLKSCEL